MFETQKSGNKTSSGGIHVLFHFTEPSTLYLVQLPDFLHARTFINFHNLWLHIPNYVSSAIIMQSTTGSNPHTNMLMRIKNWPRVSDRKMPVGGDMLWKNPNWGVSRGLDVNACHLRLTYSNLEREVILDCFSRYFLFIINRIVSPYTNRKFTTQKCHQNGRLHGGCRRC